MTGQVEGGSEVAGGVDSNGAGKTALVMAPLWAITGDVDTRSEVQSIVELLVCGGTHTFANKTSCTQCSWVLGVV